MIDDTAVSLLLCAVGMAAYLFGRIQDPAWRCLMLRRITKQNWIIVMAMAAGQKLLQSFVVNAEHGEIHIGSNAWPIAKNRIYSKANPTLGFNITQDSMYSETLGIEGQVPVMIVDTNNCKPLFIEGDKAEVSAGEYAAWSKKYLSHKKEELEAGKGIKEGLMFIILFAALAAAAFGFMNMDKLNAIEKKTAPEMNQTENSTAHAMPQEIQPALLEDSMKVATYG